jgi:cell division protein YceG involved in septum cleavage
MPAPVEMQAPVVMPAPAEPPAPLEMPASVEPPPVVAPPVPPPIASSTLSRAPVQPPMTLDQLAASASAGTGARPPRRRRSLIARLAAVLALAAVVVAVVLVLHSREPKPTAPLAPPPVVKVLIPEGKTRAQIAQIANTDGLKGNYLIASRRSALLSPAGFGAPKGTPDLEGFLFPATYDMDPGAQVARLVEEQLEAFHENFGATDIARAKALHVTPYQLLIVASMVEREAQIPGDRPKIAAVIYNRLAQGMPLGIDASIYYAVEKATGIATYTQELTEAQLHIDSPYNTRTHVGLPPTPISNPGAASIHAAAYPAHVAYLYYVAGADGCGEQVFSDTQSEFEVNAAAYKAAVAHNGGHPPVCKHK